MWKLLWCAGWVLVKHFKLSEFLLGEFFRNLLPCFVPSPPNAHCFLQLISIKQRELGQADVFFRSYCLASACPASKPVVTLNSWQNYKPYFSSWALACPMDCRSEENTWHFLLKLSSEKQTQRVYFGVRTVAGFSNLIWLSTLPVFLKGTWCPKPVVLLLQCKLVEKIKC